GSVYTEMNYETDDTLLGIFIYIPIKPVIFKEYKVGGINKLSKSNTEVTGVSGSEFIACYVDN
ncbi:transcriptional regulator, partial [Bacillus cereus]